MKRLGLGLVGLCLSIVALSSGVAKADTQYVRCESVSRDYARCAVDGAISSVSVNHQISNAPCNYGSSWGYDRNGIWVDRGCRAIFAVEVRRRQTTHIVRCESTSYDYRECEADGRILTARVYRRLSNSACNSGQSWGVRGNTLWVDKGCRADFAVTLRDRF